MASESSQNLNELLLTFSTELRKRVQIRAEEDNGANEELGAALQQADTDFYADMNRLQREQLDLADQVSRLQAALLAAYEAKEKKDAEIEQFQAEHNDWKAASMELFNETRRDICISRATEDSVQLRALQVGLENLIQTNKRQKIDEDA
ncbi:hypothetical protein S40288_11680 [Stachybotrys chartarum IBT 40288]|nr:hypothetical protein S40288_11680 [Stachybotrys chartarum IBT 40288]